MSDTGLFFDDGLEILAEDECLRLMASVPIGRIAVTMGALPAVFPVNFTLDDRRVIFRTGAGTKLHAAIRRAVVAFEVDHFDSVYHSGWSVLAIGQATHLADELEILSSHVTPWAEGDRHDWVGIDIELLSGRRINHLAVDPTHA